MITALKPYPAMKDSGVPWLGQVPEHWKPLPGRACFTEKKVPNAGLAEATVLSLSYGRIVVKPADRLHGLVPASFETYQIVDPGDIIVRPTDLQNDWNSLRFGLSGDRGIITSAYMCLRTTSRLTREYGHLLLHAYDLMKVFYGLGSGLRQNLDWRDFRYLPCLAPPLPEQAAIVRFLDYYDRRIRRYIRAKQKLTKLLEEQKQAIIHSAVTGQIDVRTGKPYPRYKPSGVEWLGDIPEHWADVHLRYLVRCLDGQRVPLNAVERGAMQGEYPYWGANRVIDHIDRWLFDEPLVLLGEDGAPFSEPGRDVAFAVSGRIWVNNHTHVLRCGKHVTPRFLAHALNSVDYTGFIGGSTRDKLTQQDMGAIPIQHPPLPEQQAIVQCLDQQTTSLATAIERAKSQIVLLREYRTRLIADVVTGKLDVREAAANLPGEPEDDEPETDIIEETEADEESALVEEENNADD